MGSTLSNSKFLNWIKAALAVLYTKEEIEPVVCDEIVKFQQKCLQDIYISNGLSAGSTCSTCRTENVIKCPTDKICKIKDRRCNFHKNRATTYRPSCRNKICHSLKFEIDDAHRYGGPSYKNTDATKWCSNPWEIAKCFMSTDGYKDVTTAEETDFNGIINVIINHKGFGENINDDLSNKENIFIKGKKVGKAVRHAPKFELEDTDLTQYFTDLTKILSDPGFVTMSKSPGSAIRKLKELEKDDFTVLKGDILKVLDDVGKKIQNRIRSERDEAENLILELTKYIKDIKDTEVSIKQLIEFGIQMIKQETTLGVQKVHNATEQALTRLQEEKENKSGHQNQENESIWQWIYMGITWPFQWIIYERKKRGKV